MRGWRGRIWKGLVQVRSAFLHPRHDADRDSARSRYESDGEGLMIGSSNPQIPQEPSLDVAAQRQSWRVSQAVRLGAPHGFTPPLTSWLSVARSVSVAY